MTSAPAFFTAPIDSLALEFAEAVTVATLEENKLDSMGRFTKRAKVQPAIRAPKQPFARCSIAPAATSWGHGANGASVTAIARSRFRSDLLTTSIKPMPQRSRCHALAAMTWRENHRQGATSLLQANQLVSPATTAKRHLRSPATVADGAIEKLRN